MVLDVSQGTVATCPKCDGIFGDIFVRDLLRSVMVKEFENWLTLREAAVKSVVTPF